MLLGELNRRILLMLEGTFLVDATHVTVKQLLEVVMWDTLVNNNGDFDSVESV